MFFIPTLVSLVEKVQSVHFPVFLKTLISLRYGSIGSDGTAGEGLNIPMAEDLGEEARSKQLDGESLKSSPLRLAKLALEEVEA